MKQTDHGSVCVHGHCELLHNAKSKQTLECCTVSTSCASTAARSRRPPCASSRSSCTAAASRGFSQLSRKRPTRKSALRYAAPEMLAAHPTFSTASDVFSYGIVLAALWNEGPPYAERALDTPFALVRLVLAGLRRPRTGVLGRGPRGTAHLRPDRRPTQLSCFRFQPARSARCSYIRAC